MKTDKILTFLKELEQSDDTIYNIFTQGSCVRLFKILRVLFPNAKLYWSDRDGHAITKIRKKYYDIGGLVCKDYIKQQEYHLVLPNQYNGYFLLKHTYGDLKKSVSVEKYFEK